MNKIQKNKLWLFLASASVIISALTVRYLDNLGEKEAVTASQNIGAAEYNTPNITLKDFANAAYSERQKR